MKLLVQLVTWNGAKYVPHLFYSLRHQTYKDWKLFILDNASGDDMVQKMKEACQNFPVPVEFVQNTTNSGFAGGHNYIYKNSESEHLLLLNQDMYLEPECFEKLIEFMDTHQSAAVVSPRLMKWNFLLLEDDKAGLDDVYSDQVDSLGLKVFRNRRVIEQYGQEVWPKIQDTFAENFLEVFGVSGALPLFRRSALDTIAFADKSLFDESYHSYKEDVDVAFRLRSAGYGAFVLLGAVAYHDRSAAGPKEKGDRAAIKNKEKQSDWVKNHSYKNHIMTLYKNEYRGNFLLDFPFILWYELKKFGYFLFFERKVLKGLKEIHALRKELRAKRAFIKKKRKVSFKEIRKWWT